MEENQEKENISSGAESPVELQPDPYENLEFPSLLNRVQAILIDLVILISVLFLATYIFHAIGNVSNSVRKFVFIFMFFLYDPFLISFTGGTIGHHMMNIRVCRFRNPNKKIFIIDAVFRFIIKSLLGWLSFLTITFNDKKRAIHDLASGSIVVKKTPKAHTSAGSGTSV